jgi:hypothetical protein
MKKLLRDNGLTIVLSLLFLLTLVGMIISGEAHYNNERLQHGMGEIGLWNYLQSGDFGSALMENWESEFLQMAAYVFLTAILYQRGSAESRDPDDPQRPKDRLSRARERLHPIHSWLYSYSLSLVLGLLFCVTFLIHWLFSAGKAAEEARLHGQAEGSVLQHLGDAQFWFESFQNWQSEFLSTAVLSIFLRHKGSPESKPVTAGNHETGA